MNQNKIKIKENDENGVGALKRRSIVEADHWSFLEDFEAPMWVDLSMEPKLLTEDNDDSWFHSSHPFHHHSSRHLRSVFAHLDVGNSLFNGNLQGPCSPQLPPSVSKSRGKDYRSRDWRSNRDQISSGKGHPISDLSGRNMLNTVSTLSSLEGKPKVSSGYKSKTSSSISGVVDDSKGRVGLNSQSASTSGVATSTLTTVSQKQDLEAFKLSKEVGQTGDLLKSLRSNLRKSHSTMPASRVAISDDGESKGRKSSAGKSSVGSSSIGYGTDRCNLGKVEMNKSNKTSSQESSNPKFEVKKFTAGSKLNNNRNLKVKNLKKTEKPVNGRVIDQRMAKASICTRNSASSSKIMGNDAFANNVGARNRAYSSKIKVNDAAVACSGKEVSKSKVLLQPTQKNSLTRSRIGSQGLKGKAGSGQLNELTCNGKENIKGIAVLGQKSGAKENVSVVRASDHKKPQLKSKHKVGGTSFGSKVRTGRMDDGIMSLNTRLHLR